MKHSIKCLLFFIACNPTISNSMLARTLPRLIAAQRNLSTHIGSRDYDVEDVVNTIHQNMAQRYVDCIKNIKDPKEQSILKSFLQTRTRHAHVLLTSLNNVIYAPHRKLDSSKSTSFFQEMADHERLFLDPWRIEYTSDEPREPRRIPEEPRHGVCNVYPHSIHRCLISTLRARLGCKSGKPNHFERRFFCSNFNVAAFEKRHNIILEEISPQEEKERCIAYWQHYVEQHATGMNQERKNIWFAIDRMRLESSRMLALEILENTAHNNH